MTKSEIRLWPVPPDAVITSCRGCGEAIVWGKTDKGRNVPLSIHHEAARWDPKDGPNATCLEAPSHFIDCPAANTFSRGRKP